MQTYGSQQGIDYEVWSRSDSSKSFKDICRSVSHIWLMIPDKEIDCFIESYCLAESSFTLLHSSGACQSKYAWTVHPLYCFGTELTSTVNYESFPFIVEEEGPSFQELLPGFKNPHYRIAKENKARYHALCVLANNFTTVLWQKFFKSMNDDYGISSESSSYLLKATLENFLKNPNAALTGPLIRGDKDTLELNYKALEGDAFQNIFSSFVDTYKEERENEHT